MSEPPTLYEWARGRPAVERLINRFYDRVEGDDLLRAAFVGYLEWGTRLAMHNSRPGAEVVAQAPVPRWGWGVTPPYLP
jgi:hypothetical protein